MSATCTGTRFKCGRLARLQIDDAADGTSKATLAFVAAESRRVRDSIVLRSTLRRDRTCAFCYSRTGGRIPGSRAPGACGAGDTSDLDGLRAERDLGVEIVTDVLPRRQRGDEDNDDDDEYDSDRGFIAELTPELMAAASAEMDAASSELNAPGDEGPTVYRRPRDGSWRA